jgi:hypothetical protein
MYELFGTLGVLVATPNLEGRVVDDTYELGKMTRTGLCAPPVDPVAHIRTVDE